MSDSSKRHSRKTKLVPREGLEIEDVIAVGSELEEAIQSIPSPQPSTSLLPKIRNTIDEDYYKENSSEPVEMAIQIQIESCSDEEPEQNNIYDDDEEQYIQKQTRMIDKLPKKEIVIYTDTIRDEVEKTFKEVKSVADKQLDSHVRNMLGRFMSVYKPDEYETLMLEVLQKWRCWVNQSKVRSYILAYKCNICCQGWWHLGPFAEHIRAHKSVTLSLETFHHDCVIVAVGGEWFEDVCQVYIEGSCPRCLRNYEHHAKPLRQSMHYFCGGCGERFVTCQSLFNHEGTCVRYEKIIYRGRIAHEGKFGCPVCRTNCLTESRHTQHILRAHCVRSDEPIHIHTAKDCRNCDQKYFIWNTHVCPKRNDNFKCSYCSSRFQNNHLLATHENSFNTSCYCPVCNKYFKKQCMLPEHLTRHSKLYVVAYRCQECAPNVLTPSKGLMSAHKLKYHPREGKLFFETMIVPVQCLTMSEDVETADLVIERRNRAPTKPSTASQEVLDAVTQVMQVKQQYTDAVEREREIQELEQNNKEVQSIISKYLPNKFLKRAMGQKHDEDAEAVNSIKVEVIEIDSDDDKAGCNDDISDDDLRIDDDDIGETESSVNALLQQFRIKQEIDIEEPDYSKFMNVNDKDTENSKLEMNGVESKESNEGSRKSKKDMKVSNISVKRETPEPQLTIVEDSQHNDATRNDQQTNVKCGRLKKCFKENQPVVKFETNVTIKEEPVDTNENELDTNKPRDNYIFSAKEKDKTVNNNFSKEVITVKEEKEDYLEFDDDIENEIFKEQEACLEELSKVFQVASSSKKVKLTNICVDEVKVKHEPMDLDNADIEKDIVPSSIYKPTSFKVTVESDIWQSFEESNINSEHLKPEVKLTEYGLKTARRSRNSTRNKNKGKKIYRCTKCDFTGDHKSYKAHVALVCPRKKHQNKHVLCGEEKIIRKVPKEFNDIQCTQCNINFFDLRQYLLHLIKIHNLKYNTCPRCHQEFSNLLATSAHVSVDIKRCFVRIQVLKKRTYLSSLQCGVYQCKLCNKEVHVQHFFGHWESHLNLNFDEKCDEGDKLVIDETYPESCEDFSIKPDVVVSAPDIEKALDQLQRPFTTEREGRAKINHQLKMNNKVRMRTNVSQKTCCVCGREFVRRNDVKRHIIEHLLKAAQDAPVNGLQCQICGACFQKPETYKGHMRQHASLPLYKCEMCNKCFSDSSNFAKHKKVHNKQAYVCDVCRKKFQTKRQLIKHINLHRTTKPIQCELCDKVYPLPVLYRKHIRSHLERGGRPGIHCCKICPKRTATKRELWDHMWDQHKMRISDADCLVCDSSFRKYSEVRRHMIDRHGLPSKVSNKMLQKIKKLSEPERTEKLHELLNPAVRAPTAAPVGSPSSDVVYVIDE